MTFLFNLIHVTNLKIPRIKIYKRKPGRLRNDLLNICNGKKSRAIFCISSDAPGKITFTPFSLRSDPSLLFVSLLDRTQNRKESN